MKDFLLRFIITFAATFVVNIIVVYGWNFWKHGEGAIEWDTAFVFAITLGIALPLANIIKEKKSE